MRIDGPQITGSFSLNGDGVQDIDIFATTSSLNTYTSSMATTMSHVLTTTHSLNTFTGSANDRMVSIEGKTGSYATTGSNTFVGLQTIQGSIVPSAHATYDLGSAGYNFRHLYLSSASLYIDGTKVLGSTTQELQITTDNGQSFKILEAGSDTITLQSADGNITLATSGGGDVILDPTTGVIGLKGTITVYTGNKITSSDGNSVQFGNGIAVTGSIVSTATPLISGSGQISGLGFATTGSNTFNGNLTVTGYIDTQELRTTFISSSILYRSGSTKFGDESTDTHSFTGSLTTTTSVTAGNGFVATGYPASSGNGLFIAFNSAGTNTGSLYSYNYNTSTYLPTVIDGSSVLLYNSGVAKMGVVGGNVGINKVSSLNAVLDVNGNTLISGSLTSTGNLRAGGISIGVAPTSNVLDVRGENNTYDGTISIGARGSIQHRDAGETILSIANDYNSNSAKFEIRMKGNTTSDAKFTILGSGNATLTNDLNVGGSITSTTSYVDQTTSGGYVYRTSNSWGGWARNTFSIADGSNNILGAIGGYGGNGTSIGYMYIGTSYQTTWLKVEPQNVYIGNYDGNTSLTLQSQQNSNGRINFYDQNNTEGTYIRAIGETYGGTIRLGARWDDDEDKVFFKMYQSSAGAAYDVRFGINIDPTDTFHVSSNGTTASAPSKGWPVFDAENDTNARKFRFQTAGNGGVSTAGQGGTVAIVLGQYYDSRVVITPQDGGSGSPSDQGQGRGKDLMIKGGTADNTVSYKGGRLYLNGGMGYGAGGFNANGGDVILQGLAGSGNVGINDTSPQTKLSINGANYIEMATFTTVNNSTIITDNSGYISSFTARYNSNSSVFSPTTNGIQILKAGILHVTVAQDIRTAGTTGYAALYIRKNGNNISENLITNTNTEWDMINANVAVDVAVNDIIGFYFSAADILALDTGSWSQYSFIWASR